MSNYIFKKVILDSFMSYDHEEYSINNEGIIYLRGVNKEDSKSESNGSGKSALVADPIIWCLTGYTPRGAKNVSNKYLDRGASVTVELSIDGVDYEISRGVAKSLIGNTITIKKSGELIELSKKDAEEYLTNTVGLDWTQLTSVVILSQGLVGSLTSIKPTDRRRLLEQLSGLDVQYNNLVNIINAVDSRVTHKVNELVNKKKYYEGQLDTLKSSREYSQRQLDEAIRAKESYDEVAISNKLLEISNSINSLDERNKNLTSKYNELSISYENSKNETNALRDKFNEIDKSLSQMRITKDSKSDMMNSDTRKLVELKKKYQVISSGVCSTCGQHITNEKVTDLLSSTSKDIQDLGHKIIECSDEIKSLEESINTTILEYNSMKEKYASSNQATSAIYNDMSKISREISDNNSKIRLLQTEQTRISSSNKLPDEKVYIDQINEYDSKISLVDKSLSDVNTDIAKMDNDVKNIAWIKSRSSRDLRAFMLNGVISYLNTRTLDYSGYLFDNKIVEFSIDKSNINISIDGKLVENLSGGEKRRVDIILQLALRDLVLVDTGFSSNLLVIDEALDYLDNQGVSSVLDLISSKRSDSNTIILITHKSDADIIYDKEWVVMKDEQGVSKKLR